MNAFVAPWLYPKDYNKTLQEGERVGMEHRKMRDDESDAAKRLKYSYDSLEQQKEEAEKSRQQEKDKIRAQDALKRSIHSDTAGFLDEVEKIGVGPALLKYPNADPRVIENYNTVQQRRENEKDKMESSKKAHSDAAGFMDEAGKIGIGPALIKYPNTPQVTIDNYNTVSQRKQAEEDRNRAATDWKKDPAYHMLLTKEKSALDALNKNDSEDSHDQKVKIYNSVRSERLEFEKSHQQPNAGDALATPAAPQKSPLEGLSPSPIAAPSMTLGTPPPTATSPGAMLTAPQQGASPMAGAVAPQQGAVPTGGTAAPPPMPTNESDLQKGQAYTTPLGVAVWDGTNFVQQ